MNDWVFPAALAAIVICLIGAIWANDSEQKSCAWKNGHMTFKTTPGFGNASNGSMVTMLNTVSFCVSQDGRILD